MSEHVGLDEMLNMLKVGLQGGLLDDHIEELDHIIKSRRQAIQADKSAQVRIGDEILLSNQISPKYLAGAVFVVTGYEGAKIKGHLMVGRGRFYANETMTLPASLIGSIVHKSAAHKFD